jgi:hypothetical protein
VMPQQGQMAGIGKEKLACPEVVLCLSITFTISRRADALVAPGFSPACRPKGRRYVCKPI